MALEVRRAAAPHSRAASSRRSASSSSARRRRGWGGVGAAPDPPQRRCPRPPRARCFQRGNGRGRVPDASHTIEFEETDTPRTRPERVLSRFSQFFSFRVRGFRATSSARPHPARGPGWGGWLVQRFDDCLGAPLSVFLAPGWRETVSRHVDKKPVLLDFLDVASRTEPTISCCMLGEWHSPGSGVRIGIAMDRCASAPGAHIIRIAGGSLASHAHRSQTPASGWRKQRSWCVGLGTWSHGQGRPGTMMGSTGRVMVYFFRAVLPLPKPPPTQLQQKTSAQRLRLGGWLVQLFDD
eukprot:gene15514-biopygen9719